MERHLGRAPRLWREPERLSGGHFRGGSASLRRTVRLSRSLVTCPVPVELPRHAERRSYVLSPLVLRKWQQLYPQATTYELEEASHFLQEDAPDDIIQAIEGFLESHA